jgi:hypothetical protein
MFELFSDIYFVVYKLYYVDQNDNLDIRVSLKNWDRGSTTKHALNWNDKTAQQVRTISRFPNRTFDPKLAHAQIFSRKKLSRDTDKLKQDTSTNSPSCSTHT